MDHIRKQGNEAEVRNQLSKLPTGLCQTYDRIWGRIAGEFTDDTQKKWALKTLQWVLCAKRPLSPEEILEATALELLDTAMDSTFKPERMASSLEYLIHVCGNFVALDERTGRLHFVHYSVQEYLGRKQEFKSSEQTVAEHCITALGRRRNSRSRDFSKLYDYAAHYWQEHARCWEEIDPRIGDFIQQFLFNNRCFRNWWSVISDCPVHPSVRNMPYRVLAHSNLPIILQYVQQQGSRDWQTDALSISALYGFREVVEICLNQGADVHAIGPYGGSALQCASSNGFEKIVDILLDAGADINQCNSPGNSRF